MLRRTGFILPALLVLCFIGNAQSSRSNPVDPALISKEQKQIVKLQASLLESREKLSELYKDREKYILEKKKTQDDAQDAADKNADIASRFSDNADSKKYARRARKAAREAASEAKAARKAADRLEKTEKKIRSVEKDIEKDEERLEKLQNKRGVVFR